MLHWFQLLVYCMVTDTTQQVTEIVQQSSPASAETAVDSVQQYQRLPFGEGPPK